MFRCNLRDVGSVELVHVFGLLSVMLVLGLVFVQPMHAAAPQMLLDFGHEANPLWPGAQRVDAAAVYEASRGHGWVTDEGGLERLRIEDREIDTIRGHTLPDDLIGDWILWRGDEQPLRFRVDVPDGRYVVGAWIGQVNGKYFYDNADYQIRVGGEAKVDHQWDRQTFRSRVFYGSDDAFEWRLGDDPWTKYVRDVMGRLHVFEAVARDGALKLSFHMARNGGERASQEIHAVLPLGALLVHPADERDAFDAAVEAINEQRRAQFHEMARLDVPEQQRDWPEPSAVHKQAGYIPFRRGLMKPLYHNTVAEPGEIDAPLEARTARGERKPIRFAIHALKDLEAVRLSISDLESEDGTAVLPADAVDWRWCRYIEQPIHYRRAVLDYRPMPTVVMPARPSDIAAGMNRPFIVEIAPSIDAASGVYHGRVRIETANAPVRELPIEVRVDDFALETYTDDNERIWIYRSPYNLYRSYGELVMDWEEAWRRVDNDLALMRRYHVGPTVLFDWFAPMSEIERFMALYQKHGFRGYAPFGGYEFLAEVEHPYRRGSNPEDRDYTPFIKRIREMEGAQRKHGWPKFAYYMTAEIHYGMPSYEDGREAIAMVKEAVPEAIVFTLPNRDEELEVMVESAADIVGPNAISMKRQGAQMVHEAGKNLWFYGWGRRRFRCGLADWRVGSRGGVNEWYGAADMATMNPFDGNHHDGWNDAPPLFTKEGPVPTIGMERTTAGRVDFFYLATLERWIKRVTSLETAAAEDALGRARAVLEDIEHRVEPDYYHYYQRLRRARGVNQFEIPEEEVFGWDAEDYDRMRTTVAERILELRRIHEQQIGPNDADDLDRDFVHPLSGGGDGR